MSRFIAQIKDGTHGTHERVDNGEPLLSAKNVLDGKLAVSEDESMISKEEAAAITANGFPAKNDILLTTVGTIGRSLVWLDDKPRPFQRSVSFIRLNKQQSPQFFKYYFESKYFQEQLGLLTKVSAQPGVYMGDILKVPGPLLAKDAQIKIANYLDTKTQTLDKILTAKNHTHTHLSELRQAIITNAVLGAGGADVNLQDTNIPWIGKIPAHWEVKKIKHVATVKARIGWQALTTDEYIDKGPFLVTGTDFRNGALDWKTAAHVSDQRWAIDSNIQLEEDDLLLTKDGTIGKVAMVKGLVGKATLNSGVFVIRAKNDEYNPRYLYHILNSGVFTDFIEYMKTGSTINHLYQQTFVEFSFPMPSRKEQDEIVKLIDRRLGQVDIAIEKVVKSTNLLEEYRSSLISNVVGGKVEV
ncbi:restriction endonuclease subunit S [Candidatus Saccharibacteria bacterium]|nr:restriction endonuclease subunit S [Candidatus Saccharibacteria bacterium]